MTTLRILQAFLVVVGVFGLWVANHWRREADFTGRIVAIATSSVLALVGTQGLPLAWLSLSGVEASARIAGLDCEHGQKHHLRFEFTAQGQTVSGVEPDYFGSEACPSLRVGNRGPVVYIAGAPEIHAWGSLGRHLGEYLVVLAFTALVVPFMVYVSLSKLRRAEA